jgi:hypothetical protein
MFYEESVKRLNSALILPDYNVTMQNFVLATRMLACVNSESNFIFELRCKCHEFLYILITSSRYYILFLTN